MGVYRSPFSLPNGEILASYDGGVTDAATATPKYALVAVNLATGATTLRRTLASDASLSYVEAVLGYKRAERELFRNLPQLVFGGHSDSAGGTDDTGIMHFPDAALLATLLGSNLRHGRNADGFSAARALRVYREVAPTSTTPGPLSGSQMVWTQREVLGNASLEGDHSLKVRIPARTPLILEFVNGSGDPLFTMSEEHQLSPGEYVTPGAPRPLFNAICGGCHGSISGDETEVAVSADALTGASVSASRNLTAKSLQ